MKKVSDHQERLVQAAARKYRNKTILITGSSGLIGSSLARAFFNVDCRLRLLDMGERISVPKNAAASVAFIKGDLTRDTVWKNALKGVDVVFHLAALEYDRVNFDIEKDLRINTLVVVSLLETCRTNRLNPKIVFSSSANLFGLNSKLRLNEKSETDAISLWSAHKLMAENYLNIYAAKYGLRTTILRLANVYGPAYNARVWNNVIINKVIGRALAHQEIALYPNHACVRDYLYIDDAVRGFFLAGAVDAKKFEKQYYVLGSGEGRTMSDAWAMIAEEVKRQSGKAVKVSVNRKAVLEPFDFRNFIADSRLFTKTSGWRASMTLRNGIRATVTAMKTTGEQ